MDLGELMCGGSNAKMYEINDIMDTLRIKINKFTEKILNFDWCSSETPLEITFYARNILESALTALVGRFDPFRLITIYKVQSSENYNIGKKMLSALQWSGDIIADSNQNAVWNPDFKVEKYDRAILGNYCGEIIWKPAFISLFDYLDDREISSTWIQEILDVDETSNFERCKSDARKLFSSFSKGVHSEDLVNNAPIFDIVTVKGLVRDLFRLCSTLGLISHFIGYLVPNIQVEQAMQIFQEMEERMNEL
ncbi:MAG: hypothetical protein IKL07_04755 [Clostridium sp.]|nr:hypothetical protein [Clostridium sp.]